MPQQGIACNAVTAARPNSRSCSESRLATHTACYRSLAGARTWYRLMMPCCVATLMAFSLSFVATSREASASA